MDAAHGKCVVISFPPPFPLLFAIPSNPMGHEGRSAYRVPEDPGPISPEVKPPRVRVLETFPQVEETNSS